MKKVIYLLACITLLVVTPSVTFANDRKSVVELAEQKLPIEQIRKRIEEIQKLDRSKMSREERKVIRQELKEMRRQQGSGMSLGGAWIIALILLCVIIV